MPALILMYHDLSDVDWDTSRGHAPYVLDPSTFRRQTRCLISQRLPVLTVTQWCESLRSIHAIVLTFDDGHVSNYEVALPILLEHQLKATFFIVAGAIGSGQAMDWKQIRALHTAGMEIGSHTLTHRPPSTLADSELRYELLESRRILEDGLGAPVTSVSSPTGFFNPRMRTIAQEVGYRALCFGQAGFVSDNTDSFSLKRVAVKRNMREAQFDALARFDGSAVRRIRVAQLVRDLARKTVGPNAYLQIRRILMQGVPVR